MSRVRLRVVATGNDWAPFLGGQLGRRPGDLAHAAVEQTRRRLKSAVIVFMLVFVVLGGRLVHLTMVGDEAASHRRVAAYGQNKLRPIITDRNGVVLATQINLTTLGVKASAVDNAAALAKRLKHIVPKMNVPRAVRLMRGNSAYAVLARGLTPAQRLAVLQLGNPALSLPREPHRVYPTGEVAAHITGFSSSDMRGLAGLELMLDKHAEREGEWPQFFETSVDIRVQHVVRDALLRGMIKFKARGAGAVMMDVHNGEILALVSLPDFDANRPSDAPQETHFNKVSLGVFELGSVFKVFTAAMVMEVGAVASGAVFQTEEPLKFGRYMISDDHGQNRPLTIDEIVTYSSNVGTARLALSISDEAHFSFLKKLGMTERVSFDLPETGAPLLPRRWKAVERATASYGHGISVSLLHSVAAGAAMVNGGVLYTPSLRKISLPTGEQVISAETSHAMRRIMRNVVVNGTGRNAEVAGYGVMGKTGTADKPIAGGYSQTKLVTSFLGAFPADAPRFAIHVMFDEPQGIAATHGFAKAGWNAAPIAAAIIRRAAPLLDVFPMNDGSVLAAGPSDKMAGDGSAREVRHAP